MILAPLPLFENRREAVISFLIFCVIFCINVGYQHAKYKDFIETSKPYVTGKLLQHYQKTSKHGKPYHVLKIKTDTFTLYTTYWKKSLHVKKNDTVGLRIVTKNISFRDYLSTSLFAPSFALHVKHTQVSLSSKLQERVSVQHESEKMQELYNALFFAGSIGKELRDEIQLWGISHLVAISGFHLGVISSAVYFLLIPLYCFFQDRYFPYRNAKVDMALVLFTLLFGYLYLIDFVPSFLRAFVMSILGFTLIFRHIKVLSFTTLTLTVLLILAFFPALIFNIGFWFSVMGVFYIFLYLHHFKDRFTNWQHMVFINIWVFAAMNIPVHYWFPLTSWQQLGAIPLSLVFVVFYPLSGLLHVIGLGGSLDVWVQTLLSFKSESAMLPTPLWMLVLYFGGSLVSVFQRHLAVFVIVLGMVPFFFI